MSVPVRIAFSCAPFRSCQILSDSAPKIMTPQSSESSWFVFGEVRSTGKPAAATPSAITSRQSLWISPER